MRGFLPLLLLSLCLMPAGCAGPSQAPAGPSVPETPPSQAPPQGGSPVDEEPRTVAGRYATDLLLEDPARPAFGPLQPPAGKVALVAPGKGPGGFPESRRAGPAVSIMFLLTVEPDGAISSVHPVGALMVEPAVVDHLLRLLRGSHLAPYTGSSPVRMALEVRLPASSGPTPSP